MECLLASLTLGMDGVVASHFHRKGESGGVNNLTQTRRMAKYFPDEFAHADSEVIAQNVFNRPTFTGSNGSTRQGSTRFSSMRPQCARFLQISTIQKPPSGSPTLGSTLPGPERSVTSADTSGIGVPPHLRN